MKKIFINTPYSSDANSFWRCMGPMSYLAKHSEGEIQIVLPIDGVKLYWDRLDEYDLIFMHRPCRPQDLTLIQMAKLLNIPVWSDFDDWLFHVPVWNPNANDYHNPQRQQFMAACIAASDIVSVTTSALQKVYSKINSNVLIIPNAYRSDLFGYRTQEIPDRNEMFVWRGTNTHEGDLLPMTPALLSLKEPIQFLGSPPYSVTSQLKPENTKVTASVDPILYWKNIYDLKPKVWLCPLKDDFFNHCKSNISWIEAIHAGAICIAPNFPEWRHPGIITYEPDNAKAFYDACQSAMAMSQEEIKSHVHDGMKEIQSLYDIKQVNLIRTAILGSIFSPTFERNKQDAFNPLLGIWALGKLKDQENT